MKKESDAAIKSYLITCIKEDLKDLVNDFESLSNDLDKLQHQILVEELKEDEVI